MATKMAVKFKMAAKFNMAAKFKMTAKFKMVAKSNIFLFFILLFITFPIYIISNISPPSHHLPRLKLSVQTRCLTFTVRKFSINQKIKQTSTRADMDKTISNTTKINKLRLRRAALGVALHCFKHW